MKPRDVPLVDQIVESGADDHVYDTFMLMGPLVLVIVAVVGRTLLTEVVVGAHLLAFTTYVVYNAITTGGAESETGSRLES